MLSKKLIFQFLGIIYLSFFSLIANAYMDNDDKKYNIQGNKVDSERYSFQYNKHPQSGTNQIIEMNHHFDNQKERSVNKNIDAYEHPGKRKKYKEPSNNNSYEIEFSNHPPRNPYPQSGADLIIEKANHSNQHR